jgi:hypothetical protein
MHADVHEVIPHLSETQSNENGLDVEKKVLIALDLSNVMELLNDY